MLRVFFLAGEPSGDLYAGLVARAMLDSATSGSLELLGIGGPEMAQAGVRLLQPGQDNDPVFGFWEGLKSRPRINAFKAQVCEHLQRLRPEVFVPVSLSGVNLELAQRARSLGIKVAYFSPPQVWAWGSWRVRALARSTDLVVCILPFEQPFLCARGCNARFLGNPLVDVIPESAVHNPHSPIPAPQSAFRIVIMPGSRPSEVERLRPMLLGVAGELRRDFPDLGVTEISCAQNRAERYRQMAMAGLIIAASGTATLEAALLQVPMIVVYCLSAPTYLLARLLVRLKHVSLPNLILGREVVPEFIQTSDQPILTCARNLLGNLNQRADISRQLAEVRAALGPPGAASRIAQAILGLVQARP